MNKPKVGQIIFSLNVGNAARNCEQKLTPMTVTKAGSKYFYLKEDPDYKWGTEIAFHIDTWREKSEYSDQHYLYESKELFQIEKEQKEIYSYIKEYFGGYRWSRDGLSIDALRKIKEIIKNEKENV